MCVYVCVCARTLVQVPIVQPCPIQTPILRHTPIINVLIIIQHIFVLICARHTRGAAAGGARARAGAVARRAAARRGDA